MIDWERRLLLQLQRDDAEILSRLASHLGTSHTQTLRYALRHYALYGEWESNPARRGVALRGTRTDLPTNPDEERSGA